MKEYQTSLRHCQIIRWVGGAVLICAIIGVLAFFGGGGQSTIGCFGMAAGLVGFVLVFVGQFQYTAAVVDTGISFRAAKAKAPGQTVWQVTLPWAELVEIRFVRRQALPTLSNRQHNSDARERIYFVMVDQTVVAEDAWLFDDAADAFWKELSATARAEGVATRSLDVDVESSHFPPEGLPLVQLQEYGKPMKAHNFVTMGRFPSIVHTSKGPVSIDEKRKAP